MATPAAVLQVLVQANTRSATTALTKFDRKLTGIDKTTATATTRTSALGKATGRTGSALASAARYAAGAAVAYLSIAQAKEAVTVTQDLAKTTAGLNRNLGLTVKEGSRWASVAKSRDIDAKSLTMSFTVLSRRVVEAGHAIREGGGAAETAMVPFTRLGLSQREILAGSEDLGAFLPKLADAFGEAEGGAKRQASAQQLLGRGYATILPLFADGAEGLRQQQIWADKYGTTLNQKTLKAQFDLIMAQRESKVAWLGLQVTFAQAVTPALQKANEEFQKIAAIMADDRLTNAEKFEKVGSIIAGWADKALDAFVAVLPKIVEKAGEAAPKIASALWEGFKNVDLGGQAALLGLFGGSAALRGIGGLAGGLIGSPMGAAIAATAASAFLGAKLGDDLARAINVDPVADHIAEELGIPLKKAQKVLDFMRAHPGLGAEEALGEMRRQARLTAGTWEEVWKRISRTTDEKGSDAFSHWDHWLDRIDSRSSSDRFKTDLERLFGGVADSADKEGGDAFRHWRDWLDQTAQTGKTASNRFKNNVAGNFANLTTAALGAIATLASETNKTLSSLKVKDQVYVANSAGKKGGDTIAAQKGAIVPGTGNGDKVPAMLEPGEVVWNKKLVAAMGGARKVNAANSIIPRFATGGMVDPAGPGTGVVNKAIAGVVGKWSQTYDAAINYGYDPGGGHVSPGHNVTGTATDTGPAAGWASGTSLFEKGLRSILGKVDQILYGSHGIGTPFPNHGWGNHAHIEWGMHPDVQGAIEASIAKVMLEGPKGPLLSAGQAAIDIARAAMSKLARSSGASGGGGDLDAMGSYRGPLDRHFPASTLASPGVQLTRKQMDTVRGSAGLPAVFNDIAMRESSWHPGIQGFDPGGTVGRGLWQITPGAAGPDSLFQGIRGGDYFNPIDNAAMAKYLYDQAGGTAPWGASGFAKGGIVKTGGILDILGEIGSSQNPKHIGNLISKAQERIKKLGTAKFIGAEGLAGPLAELRGRADKFGEYASNASSLTIDDADGNAIPGIFKDLTEDQWLTKQLDALFSLRNKLVKAERVVAERRALVIALVQKAEKALKEFRKQLAKWEKELARKGKTPKDWKGENPATGSVSKWNALSDDKRAVLAGKWLKAGGELPGDRKFAEDGSLLTADSHPGAFPNVKGKRNQIGALGKLIPALTTQRGALNDGLGTLGGELVTVQGIEGPSKILKSLPPIGTLGGEIFTAQQRLRELGMPRQNITDTDTDATDILPSGMNIGDLLKFAQAVQLGAFSSQPYMGAFARGGVALVGENGPELAHLPSGTRVHSAEDSRSMMEPHIEITFADGMGWIREFMEVTVDGKIQANDRATRERQAAGFR